MFDRSACAKVRLAADPHADLSSLVALRSLLRTCCTTVLDNSNVIGSGSSPDALESVAASQAMLDRLQVRLFRIMGSDSAFNFRNARKRRVPTCFPFTSHGGGWPDLGTVVIAGRRGRLHSGQLRDRA